MIRNLENFASFQWRQDYLAGAAAGAAAGGAAAAGGGAELPGVDGMAGWAAAACGCAAGLIQQA
jgi:hypothetical protein